MSAGLFAIYSFGGSVELWSMVYYGLRALANRGDFAEAYVYNGGVERVEVDLSREVERSLRGSAAVGCVSPNGGCCREVENGVRCSTWDGETYVELRRDGVVVAKRGGSLWHLALGAHGFDYAIVSTESAAIEILGGEVRRSLQPGEAVEIGELYVRSRGGGPRGPLCALEFIYTARPDSRIDGVEVASVRGRIAGELAKKIGYTPDVVVGIPETGSYYAAHIAAALGKPYLPAFVATARGRSALLDEVRDRMAVIQLKANVIESAVRGKRVLLVDDSMISGITIKLVAQMLRQKAGALEVYVAVVAPPLRRACPYGVKMPPESHMIYNAVPPDVVKDVLEVDGIVHLSPEELEEALRGAGVAVCTLCMRPKR
ncbi:phosphoribosyltransferase family protein [Pyrobaculum neutrophilum]|uniref:Amidophosphoribosyltransferase n=1 Tax=Pyrobaculum neutrophilum (strain DSM 2338 / JCM 9278 / NBRC 100436 / V24Sta) TaxID=444157 RepID=B1YBL7_PYRNV|nr:phosphoribosyltransferase family protein [Pyrobaculum neutrophilum]ACB40819.1 Amidophosphoribosyltransferase [Pyrobaculum neutrophilum V24Sta]